MADPKKTKATKVRFVATDPAGVSLGLTPAIEERLSDLIGKQYNGAVVKAVRFLPSTKARLAGGDFEILANTVVELISPSGRAQSRMEQLETVVAISDGTRGQRLAGITIPQFRATGGRSDRADLEPVSAR